MRNRPAIKATITTLGVLALTGVLSGIFYLLSLLSCPSWLDDAIVLALLTFVFWVMMYVFWDEMS